MHGLAADHHFKAPAPIDRSSMPRQDDGLIREPGHLVADDAEIIDRLELADTPLFTNISTDPRAVAKVVAALVIVNAEGKAGVMVLTDPTERISVMKSDAMAAWHRRCEPLAFRVTVLRSILCVVTPRRPISSAFAAPNISLRPLPSRSGCTAGNSSMDPVGPCPDKHGVAMSRRLR
jgi:hypothetical protein